MPIDLRSTASVIEVLGGNQPVARLTSRKASAVSNWRRFDSFPSNTYLVLTSALAERGHTAPASLWSMVEPSNQDLP